MTVIQHTNKMLRSFKNSQPASALGQGKAFPHLVHKLQHLLFVVNVSLRLDIRVPIPELMV
jgi:hypothetical protein